MVRILMIIPFLGILALVTAQSAASGPEKDSRATVILDQLRKQYKSYSAMEVAFDLEMQLPGRAAEKQTGLVIQQGKQFQVKMQEQEMYSDGKTTWVYLKKNKEVQIFDAADALSGGFISPSDMMQMYDNGEFSYILAEERSVQGKKYADIEFKPVDRYAEYSKIRMTVDKNSKKMVSLKVFSKDGSRFILQVKSLVPNKKYAPATFVFNAKAVPGVHVEDLRMND